MRLQEVIEKHGIKRIDFSKIKRDGEAEEEYGSDNLICPYCKKVFEYDSEEIRDILNGEPYQCPDCYKWFYVEAEMSLETTCTPMEDAVMRHRRHIEETYAHMDECDKRGLDFSKNVYQTVEWSVYREFAEPLFENMEYS